MNETYTLVGTDPSWIVAFMPVPALFVYWLKVRKLPNRPAFGWKAVAIAAYFFITSVIGIPMTWIIAGACLVGAVVFLTMRQPIGKPVVRIGLAVTYLVLAGLFCRLGSFGSEGTIQLKSESVSYGWRDESIEAPRNGFRLDVIRHSAGFNIRPWGSWTTWYKRGKSDRRGPSFTGFSVYWGPHGLIRGDELAMHFANWAGVKPKDISYLMAKSKADWAKAR